MSQGETVDETLIQLEQLKFFNGKSHELTVIDAIVFVVAMLKLPNDH